MAELRKAVALEPNNPDGLAELAYTLAYAGESEEAAELVKKAKRLNPDFPNWYYQPAGVAHFLNGDYDSAVVEFTAWYENDPVPADSAIWLGVAQAQAGNMTRAHEVFDPWLKRRWTSKRYLQSFSHFPFKTDTHRQQFVDGLRKLGVPDLND